MHMILRTLVAMLLLFESAVPARPAAPVPSSAPPANAPAVDARGEWHGTLVTSVGALMLVLSVGRAPDGSLKAELESPDQGPGQKIPVSTIKVEGDQLSLEIPAIQASFVGRWVATEQAWSGTFTQGGALPLKLTKGRRQRSR